MRPTSLMSRWMPRACSPAEFVEEVFRRMVAAVNRVRQIRFWRAAMPGLVRRSFGPPSDVRGRGPRCLVFKAVIAVPEGHATSPVCTHESAGRRKNLYEGSRALTLAPTRRSRSDWWKSPSAQNTQLPRSLVGERGSRLEPQNLSGSACVQCAHFSLPIGSYIGRTGPDCLCFLDFPVFPRAGMRFESHLGHSVSAGQKRFLHLVCTKRDRLEEMV